MLGIEARKSVRVPIADDVRVRITWDGLPPDAATDASLLNISVDGVAIFAPLALGDVPEAIHMDLEIVSLSERFHCLAELRYVLAESRPVGHRCNWLHGARFVGLTRSASNALRRYVQRYVKSCASLESSVMPASGPH